MSPVTESALQLALTIMFCVILAGILSWSAGEKWGTNDFGRTLVGGVFLGFFIWLVFL